MNVANLKVMHGLHLFSFSFLGAGLHMSFHRHLHSAANRDRALADTGMACHICLHHKLHQLFFFFFGATGMVARPDFAE